MPLSSAQVATIRRLLGYGDRNRDSYWLLDSVCASIEETTVTEITGLLTRIAAVEAAQTTGLSRAGLKRAEDVEFYQSADATSSYDDLGDRLVRQIASLLNIDVRQSAFRRPSVGIAGRG